MGGERRGTPERMASDQAVPRCRMVTTQHPRCVEFKPGCSTPDRATVHPLLATDLSYRIGSYTATVVLGALLLALLRRLHADLTAPPSRRAEPLPITRPVPATPSGSTPPPGWTAPVQVVAPTPSTPRESMLTTRRVTDAVAALVVATLLILSVSHNLTAHNDPFDTPQGRQERAGFINGCEQASSTETVCSCRFSHLTSTPPYDTPERFLNLQVDTATVLRTHRAQDMPATYLAAIKACALTPGSPH